MNASPGMRVGGVDILRLFCCFSSSSPVLPRESPVALSGNEHEPPCFAASVPFSRPVSYSLAGFSCNCLQNKPLTPKSLSCCPLVGKLVQNNHYSNEFISLFIKPETEPVLRAAWSLIKTLPGRNTTHEQTDVKQ